MNQLVPCGGCSRHVRAGEGPCPFCGAAVLPPPRAIARHGATRAAIFYLGATLAACGGQSEPPPEPTVVQPYGAPPDPDPPETPPDPSDPEAVDPPSEGRGSDMGSIAQPYGASAPPPPPPPDPVPVEPSTVAPPYGAPATPDSAH